VFRLCQRARIFAGAVIAATLIARASPVLGQSLPAGTVVDRIVVDKSDRRLSLYRGNHLLKTYQIALGPNAVGPKEREGDGRTPEGVYIIDAKKRDSAFHRALHVSYPNATDITRARARHVSPGGAIFVHGLPNGSGAIGKAHVLRDWTAGCIALTNEEIEELWRVVPTGTRLEIKP
jgi:murein L,D-transpeptidase YafK